MAGQIEEGLAVEAGKDADRLTGTEVPAETDPDIEDNYAEGILKLRVGNIIGLHFSIPAYQ